jgi:hypothetical protein
MSASANEVSDDLGGYGQVNAVGFLASLTLAIEKPRVAAQVRLKHLEMHNKHDPLTTEIFKRLLVLERFVDAQTVKLLETHPAAHWFMRIEKLPGEAFAKVLAEIEGFGRYYETSDPMIPRYDDQSVPAKYRQREAVTMNVEGEDKEYVWVAAIERFCQASDLRKYAGLYPEAVPVAGQQLPFNRQLRTMLWRVSENLIRANGKLKGFYDQYRAYKLAKLTEAGVKIIPTPKGRLCPTCGAEKILPKTTRFCPDCGTALIGKKEMEGILFAGHFHNMCRRRMEQLLLDCFWAVYREAEGLPTRQPYPLEFLQGHNRVITPEDLTDTPVSKE